MPDPRLYIEAPDARPDDWREGAHLPLDKAQAHYLGTVMRLQPGARVRLFGPGTGEYAARIEAMSRNAATVVLESKLRGSHRVPDLTLAFSPLKKTRTDFVIEKATELGVRTLQPVLMTRSVADKVRLDRLRATAIEAAEQTERLDIPDLNEAVRFDGFLGTWSQEGASEGVLIFCDEAEGRAPAWGQGSGAPDLTTALSSLRARSVTVLIGPEGGFTPAERDAVRALKNALPVSLGPRILRAETAALAALTLVQAHWGDWRA